VSWCGCRCARNVGGRSRRGGRRRRRGEFVDDGSDDGERLVGPDGYGGERAAFGEVSGDFALESGGVDLGALIAVDGDTLNGFASAITGAPFSGEVEGDVEVVAFAEPFVVGGELASARFRVGGVALALIVRLAQSFAVYDALAALHGAFLGIAHLGLR